MDQGSIKVGMNFIRLKTPVDFGEEEYDPVKYVCCLSPVDRKTHLKAFFNLVNMIQNDDFLEALDRVATPREAAHLIEKYEYE
jgi:mannitol/fructose-specific phosphotransferase system IIA component (Ntr-type)